MSEETILSRLNSGLRAGGTPRDGQARPAVILWTDLKCEWLPLTELILERVREFLVLGDYQAESLKSRGFRVDLGHRWAAMPTAYSSCYWTESAVASFSGEG